MMITEKNRATSMVVFIMVFSALKNFTIYRESVLQFRAEFFNLFNHPNFNLPANRVTQPTYGRITTAMDPRIVQFALKYRF